MITNFKKLLEQKEDLTDIIVNVENEKTELIDKIKDELSIITYKRQKNPKPIRIKEINGYFNKRDFKNIKLLYNTYLVISLSNSDKLTAKLSVYQNEEKNIHIQINNNVIFDLDNIQYSNEILVDKLIEKYKEYLLKSYKIR